MVTNDGLLTTAQVADACARTPRTIARWVEKEKLTPAQKLPGPRGAYLFQPTVIGEAIALAAAEDKAAAGSH